MCDVPGTPRESCVSSADLLQCPSKTPSLAPNGEDKNVDSADEASPQQFFDTATFAAARSRHIAVEIPRSTLITPRSRHHGYVPPLPAVHEGLAFSNLMRATHGGPTPEAWVEFELESFSFYVNYPQYTYEMRSLQYMTTKVGHGEYYFDGILCAGGTRHYVSMVPIVEIPIGNYGTAFSSATDQIWVRSKFNRNRGVYYRLKTPAIEYERFYTPFLWVVDLAKHVVDFTADMITLDREVSINSFKQDFIHWLLDTHPEADLKKWLDQHPSTDFRTSVVANVSFIWKEVNGVIGAKSANLQLFREVYDFSRYKTHKAGEPPSGQIVGSGERADPTIVTPYIMRCFGHMVIGKVLCVIGQERIKLSPREEAHRSSWVSCRAPSKQAIFAVKVGDTISTPRDMETTGTKWESAVSHHSLDDGRWFGVVQRIHTSKQGHRSFDVIWLYRPSDTPCCVMKYPWQNELFISDHCTCDDGLSARIQEDEILDTHDINWFGRPDDSADRLFIRQLYEVEHRRWVTLRESHLRCSHSKEKPDYKPGETILAVYPSRLADTRDIVIAEPYEVVKLFRQGESVFVRLRKLLRRKNIDQTARNARENELVYTEQLIVVRPGDLYVVGKCYVRFFQPGTDIPSPYNQGGTGHLFYITHRLVETDGSCVPVTEVFPSSLKQGFDPGRKVKKLRGLDLFCGAGNFGRGLEDGGVVEMRWANDIWDKAIHTYMANSPNPARTRPFLGSVDNLLREAIEGRFRDNVPRPGEVDFISAGSPCPGFSLLTQDKTTLKQVKNQSLVASFASFVDFYRPKYGVLENVDTIVQAKHNRTNDVLSQLFCALVGLGYQTQLILGDSWTHGAPQSRKRVFLYFAAPGLRLPEIPPASHSHHPAIKARGLGQICNGEPFVRRVFVPTAFKYVSAREASADLPPIHDGGPDCCIAFPDHRVVGGKTPRLRAQFAVIPTRPFGMGFAKAWKQGKGAMTPGDRALFPEDGSERTKPISQGWTRQRPDGLFATVTTKSQPTNARDGAALHWQDARPLSLMEVRRAQCFPDHEVLLGPVADQWKLVGNSVARPIALALGLKFREACLGSLYEDSEQPPGAVENLSFGGVATLQKHTKIEEASTYVSASTPRSRYPSEQGGSTDRDNSASTPATPVSEAAAHEMMVTLQTVKRRYPDGTHVDRQPHKVPKLFFDREDGDAVPLAVHPAWRLSEPLSEDDSRAGSAMPRGDRKAELPIEFETEMIDGVTVVRLE